AEVGVEARSQQRVELVAFEARGAQEVLQVVVGETTPVPQPLAYPGRVRGADHGGLVAGESEPGPSHLGFGETQGAVDVGRGEAEVAEVHAQLGEGKVE